MVSPVGFSWKCKCKLILCRIIYQQPTFYNIFCRATYEQTAFGGAQVKFYLCIEIHVVDDNIAYYYQLTGMYGMWFCEVVSLGNVYNNL